VTVQPIIQKACTTTANPGPAAFDPGPPITQNAKSQSPTTCDAGAEGSTVTYHVAISNPSTTANNNVVVDQICDNQYGTIYDDNLLNNGVRVFPACAAGTSGVAPTNGTCPPGPIAPSATGTCTFTAPIGENGSIT